MLNFTMPEVTLRLVFRTITVNMHLSRFIFAFTRAPSAVRALLHWYEFPA